MARVAALAASHVMTDRVSWDLQIITRIDLKFHLFCGVVKVVIDILNKGRETMAFQRVGGYCTLD